MTVAEMLEKIDEEKEVLVKYLQSKTILEDWHGVADAAMDLRELETKIETIRMFRKGKITIE